MRFSVYVNPKASELVEKNEIGRLEFKKMKRKHMIFDKAMTMVRSRDVLDVSENTVASREDKLGLRAEVNAKTGKASGLKANQRYTLKPHGNSDWFVMVPVGKVLKGKARPRSNEPVITVTARD